MGMVGGGWEERGAGVGRMGGAGVGGKPSAAHGGPAPRPSLPLHSGLRGAGHTGSL